MKVLLVTGRDRMLADLKAGIKWLPIQLEELILLLGISGWSLFLIARVLKGQCADGTSLWEQQICNPFASHGGIPNEMAYSLYFMTLVCVNLPTNSRDNALIAEDRDNDKVKNKNKNKNKNKVDTVEVDMEMVEVTVRDTGAGLSAKNIGKLFGEGVQFNANGLQGGGGSGLGLFITKGR